MILPESEPGVRRLCVAVCGRRGLLASACLAGGYDRFYVFPAPGGDGEVGIAPPGIDEAGFAAGLITTLRTAIAADPAAAPTRLALHVGIVRVRDDRFVGSAVDRVLDLVRGEAPPGPGRLGACAVLAAVTESLFGDLLGEGWSSVGWHPMPAAGVWCKEHTPLRPDAASAD
ncbi:hypothetical protein [Actinospica robiniae]|uniref:hypothetical protein n=1 Tax=Actinospica robiniae TaxID=304901 RepID=UPI0003F819E5|nr:hypothetical protein [Actinospica robiniae]